MGFALSGHYRQDRNVEQFRVPHLSWAVILSNGPNEGDEGGGGEVGEGRGRGRNGAGATSGWGNGIRMGVRARRGMNGGNPGGRGEGVGGRRKTIMLPSL